jgi:hypothetical protein
MVSVAGVFEKQAIPLLANEAGSGHPAKGWGTRTTIATEGELVSWLYRSNSEG